MLYNYKIEPGLNIVLSSEVKNQVKRDQLLIVGKNGCSNLQESVRETLRGMQRVSELLFLSTAFKDGRNREKNAQCLFRKKK